MNNTLVIFLAAYLLFSCKGKTTPELVFEEPQPNVSKNQGSFGYDIQGKYLNARDSSFVFINGNSIIKKCDYQSDFLRSEIDPDAGIDINNNNSIISWLNNQGIKATIEKDSIHTHHQTKDTLFKISENNVLRKLKGYYFLNTRLRDNEWDVLRMGLTNKKFLNFSKMSPLDSLEKFESITNINRVLDDSGRVVQLNMKPSKKELKKLIKGNAFLPTDEVYIKIEK